jgi:hypothetical protein
LIIFRIDVDYPYRSRIKSFVYTISGLRLDKNYLENSKIIARMINDSVKKTKAFWFFTPKTIPDKEMLELISNCKHEIGLHVVNDPRKELKQLEKSTGKRIQYYTIHGTDRAMARIIWKRFRTKQPAIPTDLGISDFWKLSTKGFSLDRMCYNQTVSEVVKTLQDNDERDYVLYFHPEWLFSRGRLNRRGHFYEALRRILDVDKELETMVFHRRLFFTIAKDAEEYQKNVVPTESLVEKLEERRIDLFTFLERKWCNTIPNPPRSWIKSSDNIGLLHFTDYEGWLESIGKKTRNMIRKAEKSGVKTEMIEPGEKLAEGIWKIYNETPIRQQRAFPHFGVSLKTVRDGLASVTNTTYIGAFLENELVGFIQLVHGDNIAIISQILSMQKCWDKAVNNALIAKTVEICSNKGVSWIMYGRMGNHPTLDSFKESNGFKKLLLARYFLPLTSKGKLAINLKLNRELKDSLPPSMKKALFPFYNWISRARARIRLISEQQPQR